MRELLPTLELLTSAELDAARAESLQQIEFKARKRQEKAAAAALQREQASSSSQPTGQQQPTFRVGGQTTFRRGGSYLLQNDPRRRSYKQARRLDQNPFCLSMEVYYKFRLFLNDFFAIDPWNVHVSELHKVSSGVTLHTCFGMLVTAVANMAASLEANPIQLPADSIESAASESSMSANDGNVHICGLEDAPHFGRRSNEADVTVLGGHAAGRARKGSLAGNCKFDSPAHASSAGRPSLDPDSDIESHRNKRVKTGKSQALPMNVMLKEFDIGFANELFTCTGAFQTIVSRSRALLWFGAQGGLCNGDKMFPTPLLDIASCHYDWGLHAMYVKTLQLPHMNSTLHAAIGVPLTGLTAHVPICVTM